VQRVKKTDGEHFDDGDGAIWSPDTATYWAVDPIDAGPRRYPGDWVIRAGYGRQNLDLLTGDQAYYAERAKAILDPAGKLNPAAFPIAGENR
jgi:hypothetical protein